MRICLVVHGFPPVERTGVEYYTLGLCRALVRQGHRVEVFVPRRDPQLADLALRREEFDGFAVNWITNNQLPGSPREALLVPQLKGAFAAFLERERPEVVHFQHLIKLGLDLVQVARERDLPVIYTAHDYYPICHRYTLLRPDLQRCEVRGDARACARCDQAVGHLNAQPGLSDYHAGVLPGQLSAPAWAKLEQILGDRLAPDDPAREVLEGLVPQRESLDKLRREAYLGFDLVLAPSLHLIEELVRAGFPRERLEHQPIGFENSDLVGLPPVRPERSRPVRFAFLGGMSKQKGVHVLLEAFARLRGRASLSIWGGSSDTAYVRLVRERCGEVGAELRGSYERVDLPMILSEVDALVVPSIWVENYPLVIREGFSAGRPVIASRLGAMPESVRDGVDGLLFAPDDPEDLARQMARCIDEPGLLQQLARGIGPVKTMDEEARQLAARYEALLSRGRAARTPPGLPESLTVALARYEELAALPARELFVRVLSGLDELRESWSDEVGGIRAVELLALGLGQGSEAQDRLRDAHNEIAWLRGKKEEFEEGREELMTLFEDLDKVLTETRAGSRRQAEELQSAGEAERQKESELKGARERLQELESVLLEKNRHIGDVEGHLREAGRYIRHKDQEYRDLEDELRKAGAFVRQKEQELESAREVVRAREQELGTSRDQLRGTEDQLRGTQDQLRGAKDELRGTQEELVAGQERQRTLDTGLRSTARLGATAIDTQTAVLNRALQPMLARLHALQDPRGVFEPPSSSATFLELVKALGNLRKGIDGLGQELEWLRPMKPELDWRRSEMSRAADSFRRLPLASLLARTRMGRRLSGWRDGPPASEGGENGAAARARGADGGGERE
jgi:glycosyltransferase involved in cell wall biosynthesis/predicted  nucleic acid-binding Zn-ribbon protein